MTKRQLHAILRARRLRAPRKLVAPPYFLTGFVLDLRSGRMVAR
jgi:hypothetical protein